MFLALTGRFNRGILGLNADKARCAPAFSMSVVRFRRCCGLKPLLKALWRTAYDTVM